MKLVIATKVPNLANAISNISKYDVIQVIENSSDLNAYFAGENSAEVLLCTEKIDGRGNISDILIRLKKEHPLLRIIFLASGTLTSEYSIRQAFQMVKAGIYDLFYKGNIRLNDITDMLDHPMTKADCREIVNKMEEIESLKQTPNQPTIIAPKVDVSRDNVFVFSSAKPGTGKSFVASNSAVTVAKFARKVNGRKPRVLLCEGDLQTLSVGTIFGLHDDQYNLVTCLNKVRDFMISHTLEEWNGESSNEVKAFVKKACLKVNDLDNLFILEGHNFDFDEIQEIDPSTYYYLIEYLSREFDIVIVDASSSLQHRTTDPLFQLAKTIYLILSVDYNNLKLNTRYIDLLANMGLLKKVKYILNMALVGEAEKESTIDFNYTDEALLGTKIEPDFKVPMVDLSLMYNSTYEHKPIAMDNSFSTLVARVEFIRIANGMAKLEGLKSVLDEIEALRIAVKKGKIK